jgi:hypothetical protein
MYEIDRFFQVLAKFVKQMSLEIWILLNYYNIEASIRSIECLK